MAAGQVLVRASRRKRPSGRDEVVALSADELEWLRLEHEAHKRVGRPWRAASRFVGRAAILLAVILALCAYVVKYDSKIAKDVWQGVRVAAVLAIMLALGKVINSVLGWNPHAVLLPVVMGTMVMTIAYDQRFALALGSFLSAVMVLQLRGPLSLLMVMVTAVVVSVLQLREVRTRSKLIQTAALTAAAVFAMVWALGWIANVPARFSLIDGTWGAGFTILAGFLIQGLLPVIERLFGIVTSMTLLEWCDASKPLLKNLAMQAPGTYNHSLQLGAMCESAAESIGARGLLARTGAYYHDIGKINKAEYFVENQAGSASKHAKLSPAMSLLIITGHVKDGLELAREYNLPPVLHEFIATHHGTTLVQYFYQAAAQQRKASAEAAPDEMEFRYPGPKPHSKEAAILMLADAAESSVRSMAEPTPGRIENQVHTVVNRRLMDRQLDECDLTLEQVHALEASLVRSLCGIYHARIAYPVPAREKPSAAETPQPKPAAEGK
jgi:putative nucleotidyltransferase with HDIG domain